MSALTLVIGNHNYSSWSLRPWLFLRMHGIDFELIRIPLDEPGTAAALALHSPTARVPVLLDGELVVWESLAICEHAAERAGIDGWPADRAARAAARSWAHEMHAGFAAMRDEFPMNCRARRRGPEPSAAAARDIARIGEIWSDARTRFGEWRRLAVRRVRHRRRDVRARGHARADLRLDACPAPRPPTPAGRRL